MYGSTLSRVSQPAVRFGRYCDAYKGAEKITAWQAANSAYQAANYVEAYTHFFEYLRDDLLKNVWVLPTETGLQFDFYQGSKHIVGTVTPHEVTASARVVHCTQLGVGFMRRLLEANATLLYASFCLDETNDVQIRFSSATTDCPPQKLYQALKELAVAADKEDDLLVHDFEVLQLIAHAYKKPIRSSEAKLKHQFLTQKNQQILTAAANLDPHRHAGGAAYLMLDWVYKIDYLLVPEGFTMDICDRVHQHYFEPDTRRGIHERSLAMQHELASLNALSEDDTMQEFYTILSTFGISKAVSLADITPLIDAQLPIIQHFILLRRLDIAEAIVGYVVGFCFFSYAIPKPIRSLFHLWYALVENDFFTELGFSYPFFDTKNNAFTPQNQAEIEAEIDFFIQKYQADYPFFTIDKSKLNFSSLAQFGYSFLSEIKQINL